MRSPLIHLERSPRHDPFTCHHLSPLSAAGRTASIEAAKRDNDSHRCDGSSTSVETERFVGSDGLPSMVPSVDPKNDWDGVPIVGIVGV